MKIAATSDTHGRYGTVIPPCDVFIHAGDITAGGTILEMMDYADWLNRELWFRHAIIVPGNHDRCFAETRKLAPALFAPHIHVLIDQGVTIEGKTFWGSPWTPPFRNWWFMASEEELAHRYLAMPKTLDVLVTHGPPHGILDPGFEAEHAGSEALRDAVEHRKIGLHIFGHLHGAAGRQHINGATGTTYANVGAVDEAYQFKRQPFTFTI